jgi:hypothetical protein
MTDETKRRRSGHDRARRRAIRAHASRAGVPYSVAARHLDGSTPVEISASVGRTVYPPGSDPHRRALVAARQRWSYDLRVRDTRLAARPPLGRAEHLVIRFPTTRGEPGTGVGLLYHGEARQALIAMLYAAAGHARPELVASAPELAWIAELGEEAAVDEACAGLDRAARTLLDQDRWRMWSRIDAALAGGEADPDREVHWTARTLRSELGSLSPRTSVDGARHTLDAVLVAREGGHAPGTRVRIRTRPHGGHPATIVVARWAASGPPVGYGVLPDRGPDVVDAVPRHLTLLTEVPDVEPIDA